MSHIRWSVFLHSCHVGWDKRGLMCWAALYKDAGLSSHSRDATYAGGSFGWWWTARPSTEGMGGKVQRYDQSRAVGQSSYCAPAALTCCVVWVDTQKAVVFFWVFCTIRRPLDISSTCCLNLGFLVKHTRPACNLSQALISLEGSCSWNRQSWTQLT